MMLPSHLLATSLGCALLSLARPVARREWLLAIAFGVAIDLDHLLQFPAYLATHGWSAVSPSEVAAWGSSWQGFMHTPWALALLAPAMLAFRSWMPLAAWGLHMVLDFVVATRYVHFGGALEWSIIAAMLVAFAAFIIRDHRLHGAGQRLREHLAARALMVFGR